MIRPALIAGLLTAFAAPLVPATDAGQAGQIYPIDGNVIYGASWGAALDAAQALAAAIGQDGLNRDLVIE